MPSQRIHLLRTEGEWKYVAKKLQEVKNCDLHSYLRREISRLKNKFAECIECVTPAEGELKRFRHNVPVDIYNELIPLSHMLHKPIASIIDDFLIMPLLLPGKDAAL